MSEQGLTDADHIQAMMSSPGWAIVEAWLEKSDKHITRACRDELMQMRWDEREKWLPFYAGQAEVIMKLREHLKSKAQKPLTLDSMKQWGAKRLGLDSK